MTGDHSAKRKPEFFEEIAGWAAQVLRAGKEFKIQEI